MCRALEEIEREKDVLNVDDIKTLLGCGDGVARRVIREIRDYCGFCPIPKGKVLTSEYRAWFNSRGARK